MQFILQPWHLLLFILAGWVNRQRQQVIDYLRTENEVLREQLGGRRILLSDDPRRRLAVKAKVLGRPSVPETPSRQTRESNDGDDRNRLER